MFGLIPRPTVWLIAAALLLGSNAITAWRFYRTGEAFCEARHTRALAEAQKAQMAAAEAASRAEAQRLAVEAEAARLQQEAENAAWTDAGAHGCGLGAGSVQRLSAQH